MFVQNNTLAATRRYFNAELEVLFSVNELKIMFHASAEARLKIPFSEVQFADDFRLSESDLLYFRSVVKRLQAHEPFQYIVGNTDFYGLMLYCDSRALIPRPETEELVAWVIESLQGQKNGKIADICTGSGCIALALKSELPHFEILATDKSKDALALAEKNAKKVKLDIQLCEADALQPLDSDLFSQNSFSVWVSNPPYIPEKDKKWMHKNVLDFEPEMALFVSDQDPLIFYREIGKQALIYLQAGGQLFFEIHENLALETQILLEQLGFEEIELKEDLQGKKRMLKALKPKNESNSKDKLKSL